MSPDRDSAGREDPAEAKQVEVLQIYRDDEVAGQLERSPFGAKFTYLDSYLKANADDPLASIGFRLPLRPESFEVRGVNLHPFFAGLLPEGIRLRALVRGVKTSEDDLFSLLAAAGHSTVGNISASWPDREKREITPWIDPRKSKDIDFAEILERSLDWSLGADAVTVSGIQPKVSAGMISLPVQARSRRREYLLKLAPTEFPRLVENEAFYMRLAKAAGIETANVEVIEDRRGNTGLLVERFDRVFDKTSMGSPPKKLHQEDACQLLDKYPAEKYRLDLKQVAESLDVCSAPIVERGKLLRLQAFSYLIANGDLHAKNVSVYERDGLVTLTPAYDLLSTLPYGDDELAMKIEGRDKKIRRQHFIDFGGRLGLKAPAIETMLDSLISKVSPYLSRQSEIGLGERRTRQLERVMKERMALLAK